MPAGNKITIGTLRTRKREGRKISMLTCYDYATARLMAEAGIDSLLVGDTYAELLTRFSGSLAFIARPGAPATAEDPALALGVRIGSIVLTSPRRRGTGNQPAHALLPTGRIRMP